MKRRRTLEPRRIRNAGGLRKFLLLALAAAVVGGLLAWLLAAWLPPVDPQAEKIPLYHRLPGMVGLLTVLAVLGLLFFGVRAYLSGSPARLSLQRTRMKIKR
jgi:hypothetical protein